MSLTAEQLALRKTRIGSSEIGMLLGLSPHGGPLEVFMGKTLPAHERNGEHMEWGSTVEWSILEYHAKREGMRIERPGTLLHPDHKFICATPDGIGTGASGVPMVIEAKNVGRWMSGDWGEEGDDCPFHFLSQVHWEMGATVRLGLTGELGHLVPAIAGEAPRKYEVRFDAELYAGLIEVAAKFVRDHLETGKPPDASPSDTAEYIRRRYVKHDDNLLEPTPELTALVTEVSYLRQQKKALETDLVDAENRLKTAIGEACGVVGLCTWKTQKRSAYAVKESAHRVLRLTAQKEG